MWLEVIKLAVGAAGGAACWLWGYRAGQRKVADEMIADKETGRAVMERLALVHGARIEMFDLGAGGGGR